MHGFGDNFHQLAIIRKLVKAYDVWLETSFPSLYADLPVHCVARGTRLRTQLRNRDLEKDGFVSEAPCIRKTIKITYSGDEINNYGSVVAAMLRHTGLDDRNINFSFNVPDAWLKKADDLIALWKAKKPILFYRPLVVRTEWNNCEKRNPDEKQYVELLRYIRDEFFVVSVADLVPYVEWAVSEDIKADKEYHHGELDFQTITALIYRSALVFASAGFAIPAARSVGTSAVCVFGAYENSSSFSQGEGAYLGIDPMHKCNHYSKQCSCKKDIDMDLAKQKIRSFINANVAKG
jgi:ADP-heptose:LPS heptosyltransferase